MRPESECTLSSQPKGSSLGNPTVQSPVTEPSEMEQVAHESVEPAFGVEPAELLPEDDFNALGRTVSELSAEEAMFKGASLVAQGNVVSIDAGGLGHTPDGRGRRTGPKDRYWRDYCNTTAGHICYGPYHNLDPGVYVYRYSIKFQIPVCGNSNDAVVFEFDSTRNVGQRIPGSKVYVLKWKFMCERADQDNTFQGLWGGRFAIADPTNQVEMRLRNRINRIAGLPFEILAHRLVYWKE